MKNITKTNMRALRGGSYSFAVCAIALVLVIVLNLIVGSLPSSLIKPDGSTVGMLNICEETKQIVTSVTEPVTIYLVAQSGMEDITLQELLARYADLNRNVKIVTVDPDIRPGFTSQYTPDTLSQNSIIVESQRRHTVIDYTEIYTVSYDNLTEEDYYNYYYYGIQPQGTPYFKGELKLTSALDYVTRNYIPTVYFINNHDEDTLNATMASYLDADSIITSSLTLLGGEGIPADCTAIILNNPKTDISVFEAETLRSYLNRGGNVILITDYRYYSNADMPNLATVAAHMGMQSADGLLVEGDANRYNTYPSFLLPKLITAGPGSVLSSNLNALIPNAHGIVLTEEGDAEASTLLTSSTASYVKVAGSNATVYDKEPDDIDGPFSVAASSTLATDNGYGKFVWFASPAIVSDQWDYYVSGSNSAVFMSSVNWMCEKAVSVSVLAKQMQIEPLLISQAAANTWSLLLTVFIPVVILGGGFFVWMRRRRR